VESKGEVYQAGRLKDFRVTEPSSDYRVRIKAHQEFNFLVAWEDYVYVDRRKRMGALGRRGDLITFT
jgi:hypothetical protein